MAIKKSIYPLEPLTALTSLDGRYRSRIEKLASYFSEYSLIKTRIEIEAKYLLALSEKGILRKLTPQEKNILNTLGSTLTLENAYRVKALEEETRHDVKALERVFRELLAQTTLKDVVEMIHIGLTSEDINNLSYRLQMKRATEEVILPELEELLKELTKRAESYKSTPMLARTHGQPAVPTTLGKEFVVFAYRLHKEVLELKSRKLTGKFTGAVGNLNALFLAFPKTDWISFVENFVSSLGLVPNLATTQINTYEDVVAILQTYQRINNILIDCNQDMWRYISDTWFIQEAKKGEVGSSTMPQKVNPIDFENSEGNLGLANALIEHFSRKLPVSRLQRDLTDSTTMRNCGAIFGYSFIAYTSTLTGLSRLKPNLEKILEDLEKDWSVLSEGVQTVLRKEGEYDPYPLMSGITRGRQMSKQEFKTVIKDLPIDLKVKVTLLKLTPQTYIGKAKELTEKIIREIRYGAKKY